MSQQHQTTYSVNNFHSFVSGRIKPQGAVDIDIFQDFIDSLENPSSYEEIFITNDSKAFG